ncbi:MAG TPA: hypothetical protein PKW30_05460, partial [Campylobacterales bacterium]|nr:hypothetical protein [Campylobacterales bacterium]
MSKKNIAFIMPYFGKWPDWFELFLLSCSKNINIDWYFFTDCGTPEITYKNTVFKDISFDNYKKLVSDRLGISFNPNNAYKLCDLKPFYGYIHSNILESYEFYGFGDIDVIYGDIAKFITKDMMKKYNVISASDDIVCGYFCLFKNIRMIRESCFKIKNWQQLLEDDNHRRVDEGRYTEVLIKSARKNWLVKFLKNFFSPIRRNNLFIEQHSTPLSYKQWWDKSDIFPTEWRWYDGKLTNNKDGDREFLYLHFMNWKSNKYYFIKKDGLKVNGEA